MQLNKIYLGDCISVLKTLPDKSVDCVITDPPYNFEAFGGGFFDNNPKLGKRDYLNKLVDLNCNKFSPLEFLNESKRVLKKFNLVIFCNKFLVKDYIEFAQVNGYNYDIHTMVKSNPIPAKQNHFLHDTEYLIIIRETGATFNLDCNMGDYKKVYETVCRQDNVHPAQKPIGIIRKYLRVLTKERDIILDPYAGSGTTLVACKQLNRQFIGAEIDEKYCSIIKKRLEQKTLNAVLQ